MKNVFRKGVVILAGAVIISFSALAQPRPPDPDEVPISGIEILIAMGGALGIRKFLSSRQSKK